MKISLQEANRMKQLAGLVKEQMTIEDSFALIKQVGQKLEELHTQLKEMKKDVQGGDRSITADSVLDIALKTFSEIQAMEDAAEAFGLS
jgi:hypothetical protein